MSYEYEFDETRAGDLHLQRAKYEFVQQALRLLLTELDAWNTAALAHGAQSKPYKREAEDLGRMLRWGDKRLQDKAANTIWVHQISVGSLRYIKAAVLFALSKRQDECNRKQSAGWPAAAVKALEDGIQDLRKAFEFIAHEPSPVLWEVMSGEDKMSADQQAAEWDIFVSHASEDKEEFARPLAEGLRARGLKVWFDEFTLTVGDSLRRSIDRGLARSRFGVVVISPHFLRKEWPQKELDGLVAREIGGIKVILPVWHDIRAGDIRAYSPMLSDRLAASSEKGLDHVISELLRAIQGAAQQADVPAGVPIADVAPPRKAEVRQEGDADTLRNWHQAADSRFVELAQKRGGAARTLQSRVSTSYMFSGVNDRGADPAKLIAALHKANSDVGRTMTSPLLFYPYTRAELKPYFIGRPDTGEEVLECSIFPDTSKFADSETVWWVSLNGMASHIAPFWEDKDELRPHSRREPGTWFCPYYMVRTIAQLVKHAQAFAENFPTATAVTFRCEWRGLEKREIADPQPMVMWLPGHIAKSDTRITTGQWKISELAAWQPIVSVLGGPVMRMFDPGFDFSPDWIAGQEPRFRG